MWLVLVWFVAAAIILRLSVRRVRLWWQGRPPSSVLRWTLRAAAAYAIVLLVGLLWAQPCRNERRFRNVEAMAALAGQPPTQGVWTAARLVERLRDRRTLFVVALSGGGSRAAYFDAAVWRSKSMAIASLNWTKKAAALKR